MASRRGNRAYSLAGRSQSPRASDHAGSRLLAEIALAAGSEAFGLPADAVVVNRLEVEQMLPLDAQTTLTTQLTRSAADDGYRVEVYSRSAGRSWCRHAVARVEVAPQDGVPEPSGSPAEAGTVVAPAEFYAALRRSGAYHGQAFAALTRIVRMPSGSSQTEIVLPLDRGYPTPRLSDSSRHDRCGAAGAWQQRCRPSCSPGFGPEVSYLPVSLETIRVFGDVGRRARCHAELTSLDDDGANKLGRITLTDDAGNPTAEPSPVCTFGGFNVKQCPLPLAQKVFEASWAQTSTPIETGSAGGPAGSWLVLTHGAGIR